MTSMNEVQYSTPNSTTSLSQLTTLSESSGSSASSLSALKSSSDIFSGLSSKALYPGKTKDSMLMNLVSALLSITQTLIQAMASLIQQMFNNTSPQSPVENPQTIPDTQTPPSSGETPPTQNIPGQTTPGQTAPPGQVDSSGKTDSECKCPCAKEGGKGKNKKEGKKLGKTGEFLWKPESDKPGARNLVILLPGSLSEKVKSVKVLSPNGEKVLANGRYSGLGNPMQSGERAHFRFDKPGSAFPDGAIVQITLKDGSVRQVKIPETSARFQK